ncbi:hypothetical protein ABID82_000877 [Methylobacterium sp. PvP062]|jgi:hypothetical protein|uniref:Uncharacterized protein n=2 Tax=Methylobacterium radiotolerans TaxID=31998 RepID=B1M2H9_METRJ|nr:MULTISPECIES: hypothetical protein [Methylobacterium]MCX7330762.1 hypothetical protein [Hyphomicrobiales bacterium]ACB26219.1 hypothetical protein Mrad2831_4252 [Methylobacterium radiotolerans JCM 2831]KZC03411.1 hypothetical protein AU375_00331 [Methylobacterium radiotolerans]MBP2497361.1 hypothetical protein [Methylobacterium sp. PvP105]MBP2502768.1 hypothetical protein [Methylobacterium sp. PvP109]
MGSKSPVRGRSSGDAAPEDDLFQRSAPPHAPGAGRLLQRIAEALQVPAASLYGPQGAERGAAVAGGRADEADALLHAYRRIDDPELRRRVLTLVQDLAAAR